MKWFTNLKTAYKLTLCFGVCLTLTSVIGGTALSRLGQLNAATGMIISDAVEGLKSMGNITDDVMGFRRYELRSVIVINDAAALSDSEKEIASNQAQLEKDFTDYEKSIFEDEDRRNFTELKTRWTAYLQDHARLMDYCHQHQEAQAKAYIAGEYLAKFKTLNAQLGVVRQWNEKHAGVLASDAAKTYASGRAFIVEVLALALALGVAAAFVVTRQITSVVAQFLGRINSVSNICVANLSNAVDAMAQGDLTAKVQTGTKLLEINSKDEFGVMAKNFNAMLQRLQATIVSFGQAQEALSQTLGQVQNATGSIASASSQVAAGNEDLSQRTEEQAASLEETAASMEEMAATVKNNADSSRQANQLAMQARTVAEKGGAVVGQAVASMEEINVVSKRIADIITVIDEIAFQTNLLALNAAVEAARVGEQGKGFGVVAAEVRVLAGRSATAAKEIKALVSDSVAKVAEGSVLVHQSGEQLDEIVSAVKKVADVIAEISAAGAEQSEGIEQVNKAIMQMDQITQQNAALVEEASAASQSMSQQASGMLETVSQFKIEARYAQSQATATRMPAVMKATGTYGGGRTSKTASAPKLTLTPKSTSSRAMATDDTDFEEF